MPSLGANAVPILTPMRFKACAAGAHDSMRKQTRLVLMVDPNLQQHKFIAANVCYRVASTVLAGPG